MCLFKKSLQRRLAISCLILALASLPALLSAQTISETTSAYTPSTAKKTKSSTGSKKHNAAELRSSRARTHKSTQTDSPATASDSEIAAAKSSGKVWVNLDSGIYHKNGRWYGRTKNGKFMTEAEAKAAGYKASQRN